MYYGKQYPPAFQQAIISIATRDPDLLELLHEGPASITRLEFNLRSSPSAKGDILEKHRTALALVETSPEQALQAVQSMMIDLAYLDAKQQAHKQCVAMVPPRFSPIRS